MNHDTFGETVCARKRHPSWVSRGRLPERRADNPHNAEEKPRPLASPGHHRLPSGLIVPDDVIALDLAWRAGALPAEIGPGRPVVQPHRAVERDIDVPFHVAVEAE